MYEHIDEEEADTRVKKERILFKNTDKWFNEYFDEIEKSDPKKYPKKGSHPDREYPNSRRDAFKIWTSFVNKIDSKDQGYKNPDENKESYIKVLGQNIDDISTFELRGHMSSLSSSAMIYNGTILENIDFTGEFKDNKWQIIKILSYLGFFNALIESMNFEELLTYFKEQFFNPIDQMDDEDFDPE